ncbi:MAG: hypothetical protein V1909_00225 [Candidatus Micrarchaeota archaeon]
MKLQMHKGWALLTDDEGRPITNKTWFECFGLAKAMSVRYGKKIEMIPVKVAEKLCQTDKAFKSMMVKYWIHNAEIMKVCKNNEELKKKLGLKTKSVYQWSNDEGLSSVWSDWYADEGCFTAYASRPSNRTDAGVCAFLVVAQQKLSMKGEGSGK